MFPDTISVRTLELRADFLILGAPVPLLFFFLASELITSAPLRDALGLFNCGCLFIR